MCLFFYVVVLSESHMTHFHGNTRIHQDILALHFSTPQASLPSAEAEVIMHLRVTPPSGCILLRSSPAKVSLETHLYEYLPGSQHYVFGI